MSVSKNSPIVESPVNLRWLNVAVAALRAGCSPQSIRHFIHQGLLKAAKVGPGFLVDIADLDKFLERRKRFFRPYRKGTRPWVSKRWAQRRKRRTQR